MVWKHPTGRTPSFIEIVALGPSRADWTAKQTAHDTPDTPDEVWTVNTAIRWCKCDVAFILDDMRDYADHHPTYAQAMRESTVPIITGAGAVYPDFPRAAGYPLAEVVERFGSAYFRNSIPLVLAYAMWLGVGRIDLYGADYTYDGNPNREEGHPCLAFWLGIAHALGVEVNIASRSSLLQTNQPFWVYGMLRQPIVTYDKAGKPQVTVRPIVEE